MGFGKLLEQKMKEKNVKQSELAKAIDIPKTTLSSIILRDNSKVEIEKFLKICEYLECDPEEFYSEFKSTKEKNAPPIINERDALRLKLESLSIKDLEEIDKFMDFLIWKEKQE